MGEDSELEAARSEYLTECEELIQHVSGHLSLIEKGNSDASIYDSIYRDVHTIKGSSQLFGFVAIGEVAHALETSLDPVRKKRLVPSVDMIEALYSCMDTLDKMVAAIGKSEERDFGALVAQTIPRLIESSVGMASFTLMPVLDDSVTDPQPNILAKLPRPEKVSPSIPSKIKEFEPEMSLPATTSVRSDVLSVPVSPLRLVSPEVPVMKTETAEIHPEFPSEHAPVTAPKASASASSSAPLPNQVAKSPVLNGGHPPAQGASPSGDAVDSSSTIRVSVALLDKLMTLMGEMVLVRNQVQQYASKSDDLAFLNLSQRLDIVTSEIQGEVMKTRMQPIGNILSKFQRVVRDLARDLNKKIELTLVGAETELDKTLLEAVKDPIMHIVRNSCDHGIESLDDRRLAKKAELGKITIRSFHEGGQVVVEIRDDGRGLNSEKLISKAIEKGLITPEKGATLTEREAQAIIFAPGFSTAAQVTNVSGRGVGMDVVKNNIEGIGGVVELESRLGAGTAIRLKIPLTLAILPTMIIRSGYEVFAIPQVKLVELVRVEKGASTGHIEYLQDKPIYRLRGNILPLVRLKEVLGISAQEGVSKLNADVTNIVVLNADRCMFGLIVDEVLDTAEVVVKPLSKFLKSLTLYAGATVLGDGSIALILDVVGIAQNQHMLTDSATKSGNIELSQRADEGIREAQDFLLFTLNTPTKHAIPLNLVHRLEELKTKDVEISGGQRVIRYRNSLLPILTLNEFFGLKEADAPASSIDRKTLSIIVSKKSNRLYGIEVNEILDAVSTLDPMDDQISDRPGILGNLITSDEIIVVIDMLQIIDSFTKKLQVNGFGGSSATPVKNDMSPHRGKKILLVEDTVFFRKHITSLLERAGLSVTFAENGQDAYNLLDQSPRALFDLILSDIEMPKLSGLELVKAIRKQPVWSDVPCVAITTKFSEFYVNEGLSAGFDAYLEKLKPDILLAEISTALTGQTSKRKKVA